MKNIVCFIDRDELYVKKLNNYAIKNYGKKYLFLYFTNIKSLIEYTEDNKVECIVLSNEYKEDIKLLNSVYYYVQIEDKRQIDKVGNINFIYKYQNVDCLLRQIDNDIENNIVKPVKMKPITKAVAFYSPYQSKCKTIALNKVQKMLSYKKSVLRINFDEYDNYMGNNGLSNIIYKVKENLLTKDAINQEVISVNNMNVINSVAYPEDFSVINNVDLSNIISDIKNADYNFILLDLDTSFVKNQYIFVECDKLLVFDNDGNDSKKTDVFIKYIEQQNAVDMKKVLRVENNFDKNTINNIVNKFLCV